MEVLAAVSKLINALAPINKLPPEILGVIPKYGDNQTPKHLVAISSVCSYWRNTFIFTPSLWTRFDGKGVEQSQAWLERSGVLPIQLSVQGSPNFEVLELLEPHFPRLEMVDFPELEAQGHPLFMNSLLPKLLRPSSLLRHVCVQASDCEPSNVHVALSGEFPSLESLRISGFPISITNLRTPSLRNLRLGPTGPFNLESLLDLLESLPLLERLYFVLGHQRNVFVHPERKVTLEKAKRATFIGHGFKVLHHLLLPTCDEIVLHYSSVRLHNFTPDYTRPLLQILDGLPAFRQIRSVSFDPSSDYTSLKGPNGVLVLVAYRIGTRADSVITLLRFLAQHSTTSIEELIIPLLQVPPIHFDIANDLLKSFEGLRTLHVHHSFAVQCLSALGTSQCRQLEAVAVRCPPPFLPDYDGLNGFAQDRREAGIPIRRLSVICGDSQTRVDLEVEGS